MGSRHCVHTELLAVFSPQCSARNRDFMAARIDGDSKCSGAYFLPSTLSIVTPMTPMHALVAADAGILLGLAHFLYHRSTIQVAPTCYLQDLFTSHASRAKGIGRALILAVYEHAKIAGSPRVYWQTHETNAAAMNLYDKVAEKSGFLVYRHAV
jgi:GNAT superfamily N-acetyltransferase